MPFAVHSIEVPDGMAPIQPDRYLLGAIIGRRVPEVIGAITSITPTNPGSNYSTVPVVNAVSGSAGSGAVLFAQMIARQATDVSAGTGYAPGDLYTMGGGTGTKPVIQITGTKAISVGVVSAGTGYALNDTVSFGLGGSQANPLLQVSVSTVGALGALSAVNITNAGLFTANGTPLSQVGTSGLGAGATLAVTYGAAEAIINFPGLLSALPSNPASPTTPSTGAGTGSTWTMLYGVGDVGITSGGVGYTPDVTISIGAPAAPGVTATAIATTDTTGSTVIARVSATGLPVDSTGTGIYGVVVTMSEDGSTIAVNNKTSGGFDIEFAPVSTGAAVGGTFDALIFG